MTIQADIPTVAIYNNLETFSRFLQRSSNHTALDERMYRGDRAVFWLGPNKLVIVTKAIHHAKYICDRWGYYGTSVFAPRQSTHQLCLDILRDPDLIQKIVAYAGPQKSLQLIPYASTSEFYTLARYLQLEFGLNVILAESPAESNLWIRDYIDTKAGFRSLISEWITEENVILPGFVCDDTAQAARAVRWFNQRQLGVVAKANNGESGIGHLVFPGPDELSLRETLSRLEADPFLRDGLIIVDQLIESKAQLSPSLELFVPANNQPPVITYLSRQLFSEFGHFSGVLISRESAETEWYPRLAKYGLQIAGKLQAMGYVGHFDIDTVVDDNGQLYLLEINARRTGGTYVHEFATLTLGKDYINKVSLLCNNRVKCDGINQIEDLLEILGHLLFPIEAQNRGIVITVTSSLQMEEFGCILVAQNEQDLLMLHREMFAHLESVYAHRKPD